MPPVKAKGAQAAQEFLPIETIRDGIVVLRSNLGLRAVLMVSSLNFALKSEEEQDALIFQYENFLNSLDFSLQFVVQSRHLNIEPYLATLEERQKEETSELLKVQIAEYVEFVRTFVELSHVVSKTFYAIVPFQPSLAASGGGILKSFTTLLGGSKAAAATAEEDSFAQMKQQLMQRVDAVTNGLRRLDLRVAMLNTEELVELFYGLYNPTEARRVREENQEAPHTAQSA